MRSRKISPEYGGRGAALRRGNAISNPYITGVLPVYGEMRNIIPDAGGRFLTRWTWASAAASWSSGTR